MRWSDLSPEEKAFISAQVRWLDNVVATLALVSGATAALMYPF